MTNTGDRIHRCSCGHKHRRAAESQCEMEGCHYEAEYDGWCRYCKLALDPDTVVADYPGLEGIA